MGKHTVKIKNACGCIADERVWLNICDEHRVFHDACTEATTISSIEQLLRYYERNPTDDNLHHFIKRCKEHAKLVPKSKYVAQWLIANRSRISGHRQQPV